MSEVTFEKATGNRYRALVDGRLVGAVWAEGGVWLYQLLGAETGPCWCLSKEAAEKCVRDAVAALQRPRK